MVQDGVVDVTELQVRPGLDTNKVRVSTFYTKADWGWGWGGLCKREKTAT